MYGITHQTIKLVRRLLPAPRIRRDLKEWASENAINGIKLHHSVIDEIEPILTSDSRGKTTFDYFKDEFGREQYMFTLAGTRIRGRSGILILPDGSFALQGQWFEEFLVKNPDFHRFSASEKQSVSGNCYSLLSHWCDE